MSRSIVVKNLIWRFFERIGAQAVTLIVAMVLARIVGPEEYGKLEIVTVILTILQVFVDSGLGNSLIQKKQVDDIDFSSVFYFNLFFSIILYILLFLAAPIIAGFYCMPQLKAIIRVLGCIIIVSGIRNIQQAYVSRNMLFKKFFFATLGGTISAAIIGIFMAYKGYGVWALVVQHLVNTTVGTVVLWMTVKWRPKRELSVIRLKELFSYGWKLMISRLVTVIYNNLRQLIIGKRYDSSDLAFYNQGDRIPGIIVNNINTSIDSVLFPSLSLAQDSKELVRNMTRRAIRTSSFLLMPMMMILAMCAEPLVSLVLTDKWLPCVPYIRIFCVIYAFYPIHTSNLNAIMAVGKSEIYLKLEIIKDVVGISIILLTFRISVHAIAIGYLCATLVATVINAWPNKKLIGYSYLSQIKDILPAVILSMISGSVIYLLNIIPMCTLLKLFLQIVFGMGIYILLARIIKLDTYFYVQDILKGLLMRKGVKRND